MTSVLSITVKLVTLISVGAVKTLQSAVVYYMREVYIDNHIAGCMAVAMAKQTGKYIYLR